MSHNLIIPLYAAGLDALMPLLRAPAPRVVFAASRHLALLLNGPDPVSPPDTAIVDVDAVVAAGSTDPAVNAAAATGDTAAGMR